MSTTSRRPRRASQAQAEPQAKPQADTAARTKRAGAKTATDDAPETPAANQDVGEGATLWRRLVAAVRGGVNELGEAFAESQALRILDQEIRDNDAELHRVRATLAETLARYKAAQDRHAAGTRKLEEYETYALKALQSGEDALARELAAKIALLEIQRDAEAGHVRDFGEGVANLRKVVAQYEATIKRLKQQVDTVRATESVQRAQATVASRRRESDARVRTALDSLERIKRRQAERGARLDAAEDAGGEDDDQALQTKLRRAGIIADDDRAASVLSRLQRKRENGE
jgi:phage shock protein A